MSAGHKAKKRALIERVKRGEELPVEEWDFLAQNATAKEWRETGLDPPRKSPSRSQGRRSSNAKKIRRAKLPENEIGA